MCLIDQNHGEHIILNPEHGQNHAWRDVIKTIDSIESDHWPMTSQHEYLIDLYLHYIKLTARMTF